MKVYVAGSPEDLRRRGQLAPAGRVKICGSGMKIYGRGIDVEFAWMGDHPWSGQLRRAWFVLNPKSLFQRSCSHCTAAVPDNDPAWVSGDTGYVLCVSCVENAEDNYPPQNGGEQGTSR